MSNHNQVASASVGALVVTLFVWGVAVVWSSISNAMETEEPEVFESGPVCEPRAFDYGTFCPSIDGFDAMVRTAAERYDVDPDLIVAQVLKESSCRETVIGDGGAAYGLTQIHPRWWRGKLAKEGLIEQDDDLLDAETNILSMAFITTINSRDGSRPLFNTLARYNGGPLGMTKPAAREYAEDVLVRMGTVQQTRESVEVVCP